MVPPDFREAVAAVKPFGPLVVQIVGAVIGAIRVPTGIWTLGLKKEKKSKVKRMLMSLRKI